LAGVVLVAALGGCSGSDDKADDKAAASTDGAKTDGAAAAGTDKGAQPKGDEAGFITALRALDAGLVTDEQTAIDSGYNLCSDLKNGMSSADVVKDASSLYTVDIPKGQRVVAIAQQNLCK
jgi:hypothetical protein